jgi:peroxiredoxin
LSPQLYEAWIDNSAIGVGTSAPDFELTSLTGERVRLSQYRGHPVLLTMGASWCPDCMHQAPLLQKLHENHPELVILDVDSKEPQNVVRNYVTEYGLTYPVLLDLTGEVNSKYQIVAIPTDLFIDADGIVRAKLIEAVTPELLAQCLPLIGIQP